MFDLMIMYIVGSGYDMSLFHMSPVGCECGDECGQQCCHSVQISDVLNHDDKDDNMLMECNDNCACDIKRFVFLTSSSFFDLTLSHFQMPV